MLYRYFPKMCHPTCGLEINLRRLKGNRNVRLMTMTEVLGVTGQRGDYTVKLKLSRAMSMQTALPAVTVLPQSKRR